MAKAKKGTTRAGPAATSVYRQVNKYDKILRENMELILPGLNRGLFKTAGSPTIVDIIKFA